MSISLASAVLPIQVATPPPIAPHKATDRRCHLPPEVLTVIAFHLPPDQLYRFLFISSEWYEAVIPSLYRQLTISDSSYHSIFAGLVLPPAERRHGRLEKLRLKAKMRFASNWPEESMPSDSESEEANVGAAVQDAGHRSPILDEAAAGKGEGLEKRRASASAGRRGSAASQPSLFETFVLTQHGIMVEGGGAGGLFWGAVNKIKSAANAIASDQTTSGSTSAGSREWLYGYPNAASHERKINALAHVREVHIVDIPLTRYSKRLAEVTTSGSSARPDRSPSQPKSKATSVLPGPSTHIFPNMQSISFSGISLYYLADYSTRHRRKPHPFFTFLSNNASPRQLCYRCIPLLREVYDEWIDRRQWMVSKQLDKLEWWEEEWRMFSERFALDVLQPLFTTSVPLVAPPALPNTDLSVSEGRAGVVAAPWPGRLAPPKPRWPIQELVVHDYVRGIVPAPPGAMIKVHYVTPRCECQIAHGIGSPLHDCTPVIDAQIRANGLSRTLGYRGTESLAIVGQRQAASKVVKWEFDGVVEKNRNPGFRDLVKEWMKVRGTDGEGEMDWGNVEMVVDGDGPVAPCVCCATV